jgi:hypothetical protein
VAEVWLPSDDDRKILRRMLEEFKQQRVDSPVRALGERSFVEATDHQAPEVYVAVPQDENGIPALDVAGTGSGTWAGADSDDEPGSGLCDIFQIVDDVLVPTGFSETVYNLSGSAIVRDWILVVRDKYGKWFAVTAGGGSSATTRYGVCFDAYTAFQSIMVDIYDEPNGTPTGDTVTCLSPGIDFTPVSTEGINGLVITMSDGSFQFEPLECEGSATEGTGS